MNVEVLVPLYVRAPCLHPFLADHPHSPPKQPHPHHSFSSDAESAVVAVERLDKWDGCENLLWLMRDRKLFRKKR
jgi:hypothetical protein